MVDDKNYNEEIRKPAKRLNKDQKMAEIDREGNKNKKQFFRKLKEQKKTNKSNQTGINNIVGLVILGEEE